MQNNPTRAFGETVFAGLMVLLSAGLLWQAYGISGFEALSAPGSFPMAVATVMLISSLAILVQTARLPARGGGFMRILPPVVVVMIALIGGYALLLRPLGFLPTSLIFLVLSIWFLSRRGLIFSLTVSVCALIGVYVIFRLVFTVLMPAGIVPEGEILAWLGNLFAGDKP